MIKKSNVSPNEIHNHEENERARNLFGIPTVNTFGKNSFEILDADAWQQAAFEIKPRPVSPILVVM